MAEWKYTLKGLADIFDSGGGYDVISDKMAKLLQRYSERHPKLDETDLPSIIEDFETFDESDGADYFEAIMSNFYDWADHYRVWVEPRTRSVVND